MVFYYGFLLFIMKHMLKHLFFIILFCSIFFSQVASAGQKNKQRTIRIGLTPALLHDRQSYNVKWKKYLQRKLKQPVEFIQRDSYSEMIDLIRQDKIDFAWVCSYPFLLLKKNVKLVAVPQYKGRSVYRSYIIVPASDTTTKSIADLKGKIFAYADPYSNSGYLSPRYSIRRLGKDPDTFFRKTFFTWSHRNVIQAVAAGLAQGGAVDSYIWESLNLFDPNLTQRTRIVSRSEEYGFPPVVARRSIPEPEFKAMQNTLLDMSSSLEGKALLKQLNIEGFKKGNRHIYDSVEKMIESEAQQSTIYNKPINIKPISK